jgi:hypothetical protein
VNSGAVDRIAHLHARGVAEQNRNRSGRALQLLDRARTMLDAIAETDGTQALATAIWISLALTYAEVHGADRGLAALEEARRRAERSGDPKLVVRVHSQHALIAMRAGRYDVAAEELSAAEAMIEYANENDSFAILINTGLLALLRNDAPTARRALTAAAQFARSVGEREWEFKSVHNLAYLDFLAGDLPRALRDMDYALSLGADLPRGIPLLDRARVLMEAGLIREADLALAEAGEIFRRDRLAQDLAETELERARCALILDDVSGARRLAGRARDRFRRRGNPAWLRSAEMVLLQGDLAARRPGRRLVPPALRLHREFSVDGLHLAARSAALVAVEAYLSSADVAAAGRLADSIPRPSRRDPITARLHDRQVRADLELARERRGSAAAHIRSGLTDLARHQASFGSIDLQTAAAIHGRRLADAGILMALDSGRPAAVLAAAERARAVSNRLPVVSPPADRVTADLLAELRQVVESLHAVGQDASASAPLLRLRRDLERRILARGWMTAGGGEAGSVATVAEVRTELAVNGAAMAYFVESAGELHAVVVGDGVRRHPLGANAPVVELVRRIRADLDVAAQPLLPAALRVSVMQSLRRGLARLDDAVIAPLVVSHQPLVVVSTGLLGQVPWGVLPSLRATPVVVAPSATAWLQASRRTGSGRRRRFALSGPDLLRGSAETATIAAGWGASGSVDAVATRTSVRAAFAGGSVVHIAAHGTHQTENPMFSSLRLTDGLLFAHELDQSTRTPDHVVLSACELGLATVRPGDEALGLTSVLLRLGTRSVVAGTARISDDLAAETMIDYHHRLAGGSDSARALADAIDAADGVAPFVCFGTAWQPSGFGGGGRRRVP